MNNWRLHNWRSRKPQPNWSNHGLRTPRGEIAYTARPKIHSHSRPKHILSATLVQFFRYLWFMPSLDVRSPWIKTIVKINVCRIWLYRMVVRKCFVTVSYLFLLWVLNWWNKYWCPVYFFFVLKVTNIFSLCNYSQLCFTQEFLSNVQFELISFPLCFAKCFEYDIWPL